MRTSINNVTKNVTNEPITVNATVIKNSSADQSSSSQSTSQVSINSTVIII